MRKDDTFTAYTENGEVRKLSVTIGVNIKDIVNLFPKPKQMCCLCFPELEEKGSG